MLFVKMYDDFGIGPGLEDMTTADQRFAQFSVIVYFAVKNYPKGAVFIGYRLFARGEVDDRETR